MHLQRRVLLFGESVLMGELGAMLRVSPLLQVVERQTCAAMGHLRPDVVVVDAAQVTPEQFRHLIELDATLLGLDPDTYQLTVLSSPRQPNRLAETARLVAILSFVLGQPA